MFLKSHSTSSSSGSRCFGSIFVLIKKIQINAKITITNSADSKVNTSQYRYNSGKLILNIDEAKKIKFRKKIYSLKV